MFLRKEDFNEVKIISCILVYLLMNFGIILAISFVNRSFLNNNSNIIQLIIDCLFIIYLFFKFGINLRNVSNLIHDFLQKINIKEIINVVFTQILISLGTTLLILAIMCVIDLDSANALNNSGDDLFTNTLVSFILTVITAPILEELLFRVVFFKRLSRIFDVYIGMIVSSIIFGILHVELAVVGAIIFGIANCILYLKYRNILIPMTVHFLNNFLVSIPSLLSGPDSLSNSEAELLTKSDAYSYLVLGGITLIIGLILFIKFIIKNRQYIEKDAFDMKTYKFDSLL
ncbi:MAG: type II CAAX endopeptidase family protein [Intestinibacter bartlettii]|uniref:CPBP family intramembrane glutamic endopeptidase n=1 Tax=Intestinibacter bartlettii TaxID=261299 RepID=UPI0026F1CB59|nr:type II CAAX endopeptidase family protein [Intestinibacter bartlettii]MDO5009690.1 type II CAAX endopeptidase family protein [Intestinibacter bartlettii]